MSEHTITVRKVRRFFLFRRYQVQCSCGAKGHHWILREHAESMAKCERLCAATGRHGADLTPGVSIIPLDRETADAALACFPDPPQDAEENQNAE